jgi:peptide deformylase
MPIRPIVKWGDPVLHAPAASVADIDGRIQELFDDMVASMYAAPGIGLAAPQIGVPLRVVVIDLSIGQDKSQLIKLVNPEIVEREGDQKEEEGVLPRGGSHRRAALRRPALPPEAGPHEAEAAQAGPGGLGGVAACASCSSAAAPSRSRASRP